MKLQILVPQFKETNEIVKPLLDSVALQQNVDLKNDISVIIVNGGSDIHLTSNFLKSYPFKIDYYLNEQYESDKINFIDKGVSATRNSCLDKATADYVMFCDADDMFYNMCAVWIIFQEIEHSHFDSMTSLFIEETRIPNTTTPAYINREMDSTFVHGKVHRRKYLEEQNIRWNETLTIHEDSYFNILCQKLSSNVVYCSTPFYLWKWRDESVCRNDFKYLLKTYNNMLDSNDALVSELLARGKYELSRMYCVGMIFDAYFTMNKEEWINQENSEYRKNTELRFKDYFLKYKTMYETTPLSEKTQIVAGIKNRMFGEGLLMESITFDTWIKHILELEKERAK